MFSWINNNQAGKKNKLKGMVGLSGAVQESASGRGNDLLPAESILRGQSHVKFTGHWAIAQWPEPLS